MTQITFKRRSTFAIYCQRVDASGNPVDLTGATVTSQLRGTGFSDDLTVTITDAANGLFTISRTPTNTAAWPVATLYLDVQFDDGTSALISDTITLAVSDSQTQSTSASIGLPGSAGNPLIFIDRAQPSGQVSGGTILSSALIYTGPTGPRGYTGDVTADAQQALSDTQAARDSAQNYKLGAQAAQAAAEGYAADAASAVAYQNLAAIAATLADTAVDVFIYDTSKDSDGGAWRKRTQGTSWYQETLNTATRGATREFPALGGAILTSSQLIAYDGTDPTFPMWKVYAIAGGSSVAYLNGKFVVGTSAGVMVIDLIADTQVTYSTTSSPAIVSNTVNDIAITILPTSPVDPATGLPVPTIAVAMAGGVSVIKDDGTVSNLSAGSNAKKAAIIGDCLFYVLLLNPYPIKVYNLSDLSFIKSYAGQNTGSGFPAIGLANVASPIVGGDDISVGLPTGVSKLRQDNGSPNNGMVHYLTSTWISGWMPGDVKLAALASTDTSSLVAQELVTNGTFDTDTSGWTATASTLSVVSGAMRITGTANNGYATASISTVVGETYRLSVDYIARTASNGWASVNDNSIRDAGSTYAANNALVAGTNQITFKATSTSSYIHLTAEGASGVYADFDNISVKLADADRSVNANGLNVVGTITRTPVATGSEMSAYSGFSASNYLQQPYNSALDFGTGDFCVMGWFNTASAAVALFYRGPVGWTSGVRIQVQIDSAGKFRAYFAAASLAGSAQNWTGSGWHHWCLVRKSGVMYAYVDGVQIDTAANTENLSDVTAVSMIGHQGVASSGYTNDYSAALLRVSATAPSADQISKIYSEERRLFEAGAQCTLYGASDAVTALAHDPGTNKLHVGTSAGRSVFDGLVRIANTTTPVTTAISAVDDLVMEE